MGTDETDFSVVGETTYITMEESKRVSSEEIFKGMQLAIKKMFEKARKKRWNGSFYARR